MNESHPQQNNEPAQPQTDRLDIPEHLPEPTIQDKIVDFATHLVDADADVNQESPIKSSKYYVVDHDKGDGRYPSLMVDVPKEEVADQYAYRVAITFAEQDANLSRHIRVDKGGDVVETPYNGRPSRKLGERQAAELLAHLEAIEPNLILDSSS